MKKTYARALVPSYVKNIEWDHRDAVYCPWIIGHADETKLTNEALDAAHEEYHSEKRLGDFSDFMFYLEEQGYTVFHVEAPGVWSPWSAS